MVERGLFADLMKGVRSSYEKFWISQHKDRKEISGDFSDDLAGAALDRGLVCLAQQPNGGEPAGGVCAPGR